MQLDPIVITPEDPISVDTNPTPSQDPISIDTGVLSTPLPLPVASNRAAKAQYGLGNIIKDKAYQDYLDASSKGNEEELRKYVASSIDQQKSVQQQAQLVHTKTLEETSKVLDQIKNTPPSDPNSVFEDAFAVKYVNSIYEVNGRANETLQPYSWLNDAVLEIPEQVSSITNSGIDVVRKYQYSLSKEQEAAAHADQQSWGGFGVDLAKTLVPGYTSVKQRGVVPDTGFLEGGLLGSNLEEQRKALYRLPYDEFKRTYDTLLNRLKEDNPQLAKDFAHSMSGQTMNEQALHSLFETIDIATLGSVAKGGIAVPLSALRRKVDLYNQFKTAVKDTVQSVPNAELQPVKVAAADGVGDLKEAAVQKTTANVVGDLTGASDLTKRAVEGLTSNFKLIDQGFKENPGRFGQELSTRIEAIINSTKNNFSTAIQNMYRVDRIPGAIASEDVVRLAAEEVKGRYTGIDNAVLNVTLRDELPTNRRMLDLIIGTSEGEYFKDAGVAINNARLNGIFIRPTVSGRLAEINRNIAGLNKELKSAGDNFKGELERQLTVARKEREDYVKKYPAANLNKTILEGIEGADVVEQKGLGWYIRTSVPFQETQDFVTNRLITKPLGSTSEYRAALKEGVSSTAVPPSWFNGYLNAIVGYGRTPEETLSIAENAQRKIATHGPGVLLDQVRDTAKPISKVPRKYWEDFDRFIRAGQKEIDPETGIPGRFFNNVGDIEGWYQQHLGRFPVQGEVEAYVAWRSNIEVDRVLRDIAQIRNKSKVGAESHSISYKDIEGKVIHSPFFDGIIRHDFPGGKDNTIVIMGDKIGQERIVRSNEIPEKEASKYRQEVLRGDRQVIELHNPEARPLEGYAGIGDERVRYVVTKRTPTTKPLDWIQTPTRGGGHLIPDYDTYIKQGIIRVENVGGKVLHWYEGDGTLMPIANKAMGNDIIDRMREVNKLLRAGKEDEARALHTSTDRGLPWDWDTHKGFFSERRGPNGEVMKPRFDLKQEFYVVTKDKQIVDIDKSLEDKYRYINKDTGENANSFRDGTKLGSIARMQQVEFTGPRDSWDLMTVNNKGSAAAPAYTYEPAAFLDPITSMNRGLSKIINSTYMDDYKDLAIRNWIENARPYLRAADSDLRDSPFHHFNDPKWKSDMPWKEWSTLMTNRGKIKDFIGRPSVVDTALKSITKSLRESIYESKLPGVATVSAFLPDIKDPMQFLRQATYHEKMGLYSIPQFLTQAMTFSNIYALSPLHAPSGGLAMLMHGWLSVNQNPEILSFMDKLASKFRMPGHAYFKPGQFMEAYQELKNSGFASVGGEHAYLDTPLSNKIVSNGVDTFLDWGTVPFKTGAATTRVSSWYTSYLEYRAANPVGALDRAAREEILARASLLDHNMSRASSTPFHTGVFAPFGQFLAYSMRLSDMMTGKRLEPMEKARLFGVSSVLYGLPLGGLGLYGINVADYWRTKAFEGGYVVGDNALSTFMNEGLPALIMGHISGNYYNVGKFGSKGIDPINEMLGGDKTFLDIFSGASGTTLVNQLKNMSGFWNATLSFIRQDSEDTKFKYKSEDFVDMFKEISSVNAAWRGIYAYRFGKWLTKNETVVKDGVSPSNALFMTFSGLSLQEQSDAYLLQKSIKVHKQADDYAARRFQEEYHRAWLAGSSGDETNFHDYLRRAYQWLEGFPQEKLGQVQSHAYTQEKDLISQTNMDFYFRHVPGNRPPSIVRPLTPSNPTNTRFDAYQRRQKLGE